MEKTPLVAVGVPVYRGAEFVGETLASILAQRDVRFRVEISVDGADEASAAACGPFLRDDRVRLRISPRRLGWVGNSALVLRAACATGARYVAIQPHDDLMCPNYLATLVRVAEREKGAVTFSDLQAFGDRDNILHQDAVRGSPFERQLALLTSHHNAVAYRGLTRTDALRALPTISGNRFSDFAADTVWMARLARAGELICVPEPLYRKRYHAANTHGAWMQWPLDRKLAAWSTHCGDMLLEALPVARTAAERSALRAAAVSRLLQRGERLGPYARVIRALPQSRKRRLRWRFEATVGLRHLRGRIGPAGGA